MMEFMKEALDLAKEALQANEVPVGCVFVKGGIKVAKSRNKVNETRNPTRHAEINCIDEVLNYCHRHNFDQMNFFKDIVVYVTVEPCIMCAAALKKLYVKEVVFGCPNDRFGGSTVLDVNNIYAEGFQLTGNILPIEAMELLKQFYKGTNPHAPDSKVKKKSIDKNE
ncbi:tRNA-specific adenosine deaminase 2 [Pieris brassicae]|nr:tRNA-specific adenosine deaminase 2 [Pieris brassicae]